MMIDTGLHLHWNEKRVAHFKGHTFWITPFTTAADDTVRYDWHLYRDDDYFGTKASPDEKPYDTEREAQRACELWTARNLGSW